MLVRTIVGVVGVPLMLAILFLCPPWVLPCFYALLGMLAQHELLFATGFVKNKWIVAICAVSAAAIPFLLYFSCLAAAWVGVLTVLVAAH